MEVRPGELQVFIEGTRVGFTVREFELFFALAERFDRVVPRPEIYELVWGAHMPYRDRSVDVFIRKVRGKLESVAPGWEYIHTHFGIGYRFAPQRRQAAATSLSANSAGRPTSASSRATAPAS
ncbi:MAG: winged helix-turn-helix domain-containing protein [Actinomycetota bacterium]|nr:winged helix-turn-helix domain-containing protein [Actinomycetota bacterium]